MRTLRSALLLCTLPALLSFTGCANFPAAPPIATSLGAITGNVHGGRQPVIGAHIYVYAAGTGGYGTASSSLLTAFGTGNYPTTNDGTGKYYVTTDAGGSFGLGGEYTCTPGTQVYLYSVGGDPGLGSVNSAAGFMAILGNCPASGTMATQTPTVYMNEVSTVAAAYSFAGFATDATHVASSGSALAQVNIANAFATAANLHDISRSSGALLKPASSAGTSPQQEVNSLANSLAACVNSAGPSSTQCAALFNNVKSAGTSGTTATDTATEAIFIAHNPQTAVATIYGNPTGIGTPFLPALSAAPNDYSVEINFYSGSLGFPEYIAIDSTGSLWVSNYSAGLVKYANNGGLIGSFSGGGISNSIYLAVDSSDNIWVANQGSSAVSKFSSAGVPASSTGYKGNNDLSPAGIALDASGNVWVSNYSKNTISKLDSSGNEVSGSPYAIGGINEPWEIAFDSLGNLWIGNYNVNGIMKANSGVQAPGSPYFTGNYATPRTIVMGAAGTPWVANYTGNAITHVTTAGVGTQPTTNTLNQTSDIAVDGLGNVWVVNQGNNSISEFSSSGTVLMPTGGLKSPDMNQAFGAAIDGAGNVWVTNANGDTLSEFVGAAAPTVTPLVTAVSNNLVGTRP